MNFDSIEGLNEFDIQELYDNTLISCYCYCDTYSSNQGDLILGTWCINNPSACNDRCVEACARKTGNKYISSRCSCVDYNGCSRCESLCVKRS